ncbi:nitrous oxidase accessory protein [Rhodopirellula rubra]|uniref:Nitrous oxidase accessory protein n=1 Tax=Aporhodopirellula rubra TaxID=980271 RepID=A0A7W5E307_9BACT|nr:right-handed parallel beta-helix repeat-containing protein [Aporhodopirellula rubra]MBB3209205.1 nitrous oxidase accessory protein [Aporhodopirellula rubra]
MNQQPAVLRYSLLFVCWFLLAMQTLSASTVSNIEELVKAVRDGAEDSVIEISAGNFELNAPLELKSGMTLKGAGMAKTIITHATTWKPSTERLPLGEMRPDEANADAYLIRLPKKAANITIENLTLRGPQMHGAIFAVSNQNVHLHHLRIENVLYSGIRCYYMTNSRIHDCEFIGAGGKWKRGGLPGIDGGTSGGAIFATWMSDTEIANNRFTFGKPDRRPGKSGGHYGVKGRGGKRIHIHHNTIGVNFSIEFPFEGNEAMEIDHNVLHGVVSIPKHGGGKVLAKNQRSFHIHHNYFTTSYAIEFPRNNVEIDHNLFDFQVDQDGGNLISGFGGVASPGPAWFHNNLVSNPGRGVIWNERAFGELVVRNNHIVTRTTATPRTEGLFGIGGNDFSKTKIIDNIIECRGQPRPLLRNAASYDAEIMNNQLTNVSDTDRYRNAQTETDAGPTAPLVFKCGAQGEFTVNGWEFAATMDTDD